MAGPTAAGLKIINAFRRRSDEAFDISFLLDRQIKARALMRHAQFYAALRKLVNDGYLQTKLDHAGVQYSLTEKGRQASSV